jgi:hypothetical protein
VRPDADLDQIIILALLIKALHRSNTLSLTSHSATESTTSLHSTMPMYQAWSKSNTIK